MPFITVPTYVPSTYTTDSGRQFYRLTSPMIYFSPRYRIQWSVPAGFLTDLASIPKSVCFLKPDASLWDDAAILHDFACKQARIGLLSYREADYILYEAMIERGCSKFTAYLFWSFVRARHISQGKR